MAALPTAQRRPYLEAHQTWIERELLSGRWISSGFLVDGEHRPGGGGLLLFEAGSYDDALIWVCQDPMILSGLVSWKLHEWIFVGGELIDRFS